VVAEEREASRLVGSEKLAGRSRQNRRARHMQARARPPRWILPLLMSGGAGVWRQSICGMQVAVHIRDIASTTIEAAQTGSLTTPIDAFA
jgi:hypothetical protein